VIARKIAHQPHPRDILTVRTLLKACGDSSSIIHAHSTKAGLLAAWASRLSGAPSVYSPHSWSFDRALSPPARAGYVAYERATARAHRLIIGVAESERELALRHNIKARTAIRVVYNGLPAHQIEIDRDSARARLGIAAARFVACWVGRYAPQKRPQDLRLLARELACAGIGLVALGDGLASSPEIGTSSVKHGHDLLLQGFTLSQVVHDYGNVCQSITELAIETDTPSLTSPAACFRFSGVIKARAPV